MATKKAKKGLSGAQAVGIGAGLTAAAAAAAGAYFLYGAKDAAKNRRAVKSWALKAKAEVLEVIEKAENMTQEQYEELIEKVGSAYSLVQNVSKGEILDFKKEMKGHWNSLQKSGAKKAKKSAKKVVSAAKKGVAKKAASKSTKKAATKKK